MLTSSTRAASAVRGRDQNEGYFASTSHSIAGVSALPKESPQKCQVAEAFQEEDDVNTGRTGAQTSCQQRALLQPFFTIAVWPSETHHEGADQSPFERIYRAEGVGVRVW